MTNVKKITPAISSVKSRTPAFKIGDQYTVAGIGGDSIPGPNILDTTATNKDVLSGKYFYTAAGEKTEGTIIIVQSQPNPTVSLDASTGLVTAAYTPNAGFSEDNVQKSGTLQIDSSNVPNLVAGNIKKDVSLLGVTGTLETAEGLVYSGMTSVDPITATEVKVIPADYTKDWTDFSDMFRSYSNLATVSALNTSNGTEFDLMFSGCTNLTTIPQMDTSKGTKFGSMFSGCTNLTTIPQMDTSKGTSLNNMFFNCQSLTTIPALDVSNVSTVFGSIFNYCYDLTTFGGLLNCKKSYNISYSDNLTHDSLMNAINGLATVTTSQTLTLGEDNLAKLTAAEKAIATGKGWTLA